MEYRRLGRSGLQVSALSLGSWLTFGKQIDKKKAASLMSYAYEHGINFFDNAEIYARGASEKLMGEILQNMGWSRDSYLVSSKVFWGGDKPNQKGLSKKHVTEACHAALKRLELDYLDLYFCHRPDNNTPIGETVWAMNTLISQGKVLYWGTSEWSAQEIQAAIGFAEANHLIGPTMEQPQYNMLVRKKVERDYHRLFQDYGLGTTIWSPLCSGVLTGKYNNGFPKGTRLGMEGMEWLKERSLTDETIEKTRRLTALSKDIGISMPQMAIAWVLKNPNVSTAILGASRLSQLEENLKALEMVSLLDASFTEQIEAILGNKPVIPEF